MSNGENLLIPVVQTRTLRKRTPMVVGVIPAGALVDRYVIPRRDTRTKEGYQRDLATARVNRLVKELIARRVDLPTAILLNLREYREDLHLVKRDGRVYFC